MRQGQVADAYLVGWKGRLEDRRTASNADPYKVAAAIIKTSKEALA